MITHVLERPLIQLKWVLFTLFCLAGLSAYGEELEVDIQVIDMDATPNEVVNQIKLPSFLNRAVQQSEQNAQEKGNASKFNPNITGELPVSIQGRSSEAREAVRQNIIDRLDDLGVDVEVPGLDTGTIGSEDLVPDIPSGLD